MDLDRYRVPASARDGVIIELPGSKDAKFRVALPSEFNRAYTSAVQAALVGNGQLELGKDDKPSLSGVDFQKFQEARLDAFLTHCIREYPDGITAEKLGGEYWPALKALFDIATDMASDEAKAAAAAVKKSRA